MTKPHQYNYVVFILTSHHQVQNTSLCCRLLCHFTWKEDHRCCQWSPLVQTCSWQDNTARRLNSICGQRVEQKG